MAKPEVLKGGQVLILLGDNATPTTYASPCGLTTRTISFSKTTTEVNIPDCDDPDAMDWVGRGATGLSMSITGDGVLAKEAQSTWWAALTSSDSVPIKVEMRFKAEIVTWTGLALLDKFEVGANNGETTTVSISLQSDGEMVRSIANVT